MKISKETTRLVNLLLLVLGGILCAASTLHQNTYMLVSGFFTMWCGTE